MTYKLPEAVELGLNGPRYTADHVLQALADGAASKYADIRALNKLISEQVANFAAWKAELRAENDSLKRQIETLRDLRASDARDLLRLNREIDTLRTERDELKAHLAAFTEATKLAQRQSITVIGSIEADRAAMRMALETLQDIECSVDLVRHYRLSTRERMDVLVEAAMNALTARLEGK
jgi:predicted nuclease with TOPRIM domain